MKLFINKKNQKGSVALIVLIIFLAAALFFLGIFQLVYSDYVKSSESITKISDYNKQSNIVESIATNYKSDMLNDKDYDEMKFMYDFSDDNVGLFKLEYSNYLFEYLKLDKDGQEENRKGKFGRFDWVKFTNYNDIEIEDDSDIEIIGGKDSQVDNGVITNSGGIVREYIIKDNWKENGKEKEKYYENGKLLVRAPIYVKVHFANDVSSIKLEMGNEFDKKEYDLINRPGTDNIYKLNDIPYGSSFINLTSEYSLNNTSISILKGREIDVNVFNLDKYSKKGNKVLVKTLKMELGKINNHVYFE